MKNKKSLGQNWLKNRAILEEIADLAGGVGVNGGGNIGANESVDESSENRLCIEIGPGLGTLTSSLLKRFDKVIAVEFDERLASNLPKSFPGKNLEVINDDILEFDFNMIKGPYTVVGNIPYYITSPIIKKVLETENRPERVVLLVQKEVAERIVDEKETQLSLFVKNYAEVSAGPVVSKNEFTPPPKVDSQVVVMKLRGEKKVGDEVFRLIRRGFSSPRKKLLHNLAGLKSESDLKLALERSGASADARPGDLKLENWAKLYHELDDMKSSD